MQVFDEYGNHAKEDNIFLRVDGLSFQDGSSIVSDKDVSCTKKVSSLVS